MSRKLAKALLAAAALSCGAVGCGMYRDTVDVSYPERYEYESRAAVTSALRTQADNGHVLDQTVWNFCFDPGTDHLTPAGIRQLQYLGRRRPAPDSVVFLQQANDIPMDPTKPEAMVETRKKLDEARTKAVERFLLAETGLEFEIVTPHTPAVPYLSGQEAGTIYTDITRSARGTMAGTTGTSSSGGAGASGGTSSGGGGAA